MSILLFKFLNIFGNAADRTRNLALEELCDIHFTTNPMKREIPAHRIRVFDVCAI